MGDCGGLDSELSGWFWSWIPNWSWRRASSYDGGGGGGSSGLPIMRDELVPGRDLQARIVFRSDEVRRDASYYSE